MKCHQLRNLPTATCVFAIVLVGAARTAAAQSFFGGGAVAFDPEISTVQSGALLDAQVVVSYDRKYVTIGAQASESRLLALRDFPIASPVTQGFVGGVDPTGGAGNGGSSNGGGGFSASAPGAINTPAANNATGANAARRVTSAGRNRHSSDDALPMPSASPMEIDRRAVATRSVLSRQGMYLLAPLN